MNQITTFNHSSLNQEEGELESLLSDQKKQFTPKTSTINALLNYSKALIISSSNMVDEIEMVLN